MEEEFEFSWHFGIWIIWAAISTGVALVPDYNISRVAAVAVAVALTMLIALLATSEVVNWVALR